MSMDAHEALVTLAHTGSPATVSLSRCRCMSASKSMSQIQPSCENFIRCTRVATCHTSQLMGLSGNLPACRHHTPLHLSWKMPPPALSAQLAVNALSKKLERPAHSCTHTPPPFCASLPTNTLPITVRLVAALTFSAPPATPSMRP